MKTIWFVHDEQESPLQRISALEMAGYQVRAIASSRELLRAFEESAPDMVMLDVLIRGRNGFETARELTQRYPDRRFALVLCSRIYRTRAFREEARRCGVDDYLLLPVEPDELIARVVGALESRGISGTPGADAA